MPLRGGPHGGINLFVDDDLVFELASLDELKLVVSNDIVVLIDRSSLVEIA